jgi:hypothetical protein
VAKARKRIFANILAKKIIESLNADSDLDHIKTVSLGDLTTLPSDESLSRKDFLDSFFPAIYICPTDIYNSTVNGNKSISATSYHFVIRYLKNFDGDNDYLNILESAITDAELIADILLADRDLSVTQTRLLEAVSPGDTSLSVRKPCTITQNELIVLGTETFRTQLIHEKDPLDPEKLTIDLNVPVSNAHAVDEIISRDIPDNTPPYIELTDDDGVPIGQILRTEVPHIGFNTAEQELFYLLKNLKIPVVLLNIEYTITFRSYYEK